MLLSSVSLRPWSRAGGDSDECGQPGDQVMIMVIMMVMMVMIMVMVMVMVIVMNGRNICEPGNR